MNYQLYQLLLFFAIYAITGWIISVFYHALVEENGNQLRVCKGPYCPAYGFGALILIVAMGFVEYTIPLAFVGGLVIGTLTELITIGLTRVCSKKRVKGFKWYHPLLWGAGGTILMTHGHPLIELVTNRISPWIHFGFLVIFLIIAISDYIDGIADIIAERKGSTNHEIIE